MRVFGTALLLWLSATTALAGSDCARRELTAQQWATATHSALRVVENLERLDQPVALLARSGTDLSKHGIRFSHLGFVLRDHVDGRWTVVHLLNECGTDRSRIYSEGLINFFADHLYRQDSHLMWLQPEQAERVLTLLDRSPLQALHQSRYNIIANPFSRRYQNSTAWVLENLAASSLENTEINRRSAQLAFARQGFEPSTIRISYGKRLLGGLFSANTDFTDHPLGARLAGNYDVVSVDAILQWLRQLGWSMTELDLAAENY